jgi:hypothetical protein
MSGLSTKRLTSTLNDLIYYFVFEIKLNVKFHEKVFKKVGNPGSRKMMGGFDVSCQFMATRIQQK